MEKIKGNSKDNSKRKFHGGGPRPDHNEYKRQEATERQEAWSKLSPQQQLEALDRRLGKDAGAAKQRARLALAIERAKHQPKPAPKGAEPVGQMLTKEEATGGRIKAKERRAAEQAKRPSK